MASKTLKVGLIGTGGIMRGAHMPGWKTAENCEIVAVCDNHKETADKFAVDFAVKQVFTDFRELVKLKDLDIVDIATPNRFHTPAVIAALEAGKHLMTAQHMRFTPAAVAVKRWIEAGSLGEVYHSRIHAVRRNWIPTKPGFISDELSGG